jgi:hypothetical protein
LNKQQQQTQQKQQNANVNKRKEKEKEPILSPPDTSNLIPYTTNKPITANQIINNLKTLSSNTLSNNNNSNPNTFNRNSSNSNDSSIISSSFAPVFVPTTTPKFTSALTPSINLDEKTPGTVGFFIC